jgi:cation:H+ antiporter
MWWDIFLVVIGLTILIAGGEFLVKGAVGIAAKARLSTLVIGMTVVSFGTSAPELLVSLKAAFLEKPEITIGNVIGSNIANLALVLGLTAVIFPIPVSRNSIQFDWPMMMLSGVLFFLFALDGVIVWWEGLIMLSLLIAFLTYLITSSRKSNKQLKEAEISPNEIIKKINIGKQFLWLIIGCVGLYFGAVWLIDGASSLGAKLGLSDHVIAITIVAFGTSVPELATSIIAAYKQEMDISVGNLIGSNIFNIMAVLGITALIYPIAINEAVVYWDMLWMLAIFIVVFPMMLIGAKIGRISGAILLTAYCTYIFMLF